jgi:hypothetical protein
VSLLPENERFVYFLSGSIKYRQAVEATSIRDIAELAPGFESGAGFAF